MKRFSNLILCIVFYSVPVLADNLEEQVDASRAAVKTFGMTLKGELQQAIKADGAINGISVCNEKAGEIAAVTSEELNLKIGRTGLKVRNPDNAPDKWELVVLQQFEDRKLAGEPAGELEFYAVVEENGQQIFRYMKAIPTAKVCLACHGENISSDLSAKLYELYPNDAARGFQEGDLRGAFTISRPM